MEMVKIRTIQRRPDPDQWCVIPGLVCPHIARFNGNDGFLIQGFLPGVYRAADRVEWWAALSSEFTAQYDEPDEVVECKVEGWGPVEKVRNG